MLMAMLVPLAPPAGADPGARSGERARPGPTEQVRPELEREALLRCMADERESRALLDRYRQESETIAASGHALDAQRRELAALRDSVDRRDAAAVDRYNARAAEIDARIERYNAGLAALDASRRAQQAVAQRYNANCGSRHFQPNTLRSAPAAR